MNHLAFDKKAREGKLRLVLARGIGKAFIAEDVPPAEITATLETAIAEGANSRCSRFFRVTREVPRASFRSRASCSMTTPTIVNRRRSTRS